MPDNKVFRAVVSHGVAQWFSIGLEMGLTGPEIEACTFNKPSPASKLQAIIELKIQRCGIKETDKCLLTACERIPQSIIAAVRGDDTVAGEGDGH